MEWIITFFSHYGAVRFSKDAQAAGIHCTLAPVPRSLSASCGTCARVIADSIASIPLTEADAVYRLENHRYQQVWQTANGS